MYSDKIVILDIETTGFLKQNGKIVEVGIVELDVVTGETKVLFDRVCHERPITKEEVENAWIIKNSDLTVEAVQYSQQLKEQLPEIQNILDSYEMGCTAFNNKFDFDYLEDRGVKFKKKLACPMLVSMMVLKLPGKYGNFKWPNVQEAYDYFFPNNTYKEKHRGADDAIHEAQIVFKLIQGGFFKLK